MLEASFSAVADLRSVGVRAVVTNVCPHCGKLGLGQWLHPCGDVVITPHQPSQLPLLLVGVTPKPVLQLSISGERGCGKATVAHPAAEAVFWSTLAKGACLLVGGNAGALAAVARRFRESLRGDPIPSNASLRDVEAVVVQRLHHAYFTTAPYVFEDPSPVLTLA